MVQRDKWHGYRQFVDALVEDVESAGALGPKRVRAGVWNPHITAETSPEQHRMNELLARLSRDDREVIAGMLKDAFVSGVHKVLVELHEREIPPFENGYEGTPFHDFVGRLDGWEWPNRARE